MNAIPLRVTLRVIEELERLGIPYVLVGSLATSAVGVPRSTIDSDLVAEIGEPHAAPLTRALEGEFYIDAAMILDAVRRRAMFNVIHLATAFKVDVYVLGRRPFDRSEFERRQPLEVVEGREVFLATPEDLVLSKLEWYRRGDEVSERQWKDVMGVLHVRGEGLDWIYLRHWARELGVEDLLERARSELPPRGAQDGPK